ncbi:MAG: DUF1992 domain-containing protein [Microbacterium sp.]|uniref:DnaJ family domain-containing protein n=1 Tax=Microbacterium sp. TaxID=51671 RepID=UPI0039E390FE
MTEDPRLAAARRRAENAARADRGDPEDRAQRGATASGQSELQRAAMVETAIELAIRRGDFDDLPGAGKPLPGLGGPPDPDWWLRRKIETEQLRGLGPAALTLRVENTELDARLDDLSREAEVRETVEDFNRRVIEARRQLLGGPPVVTPTRDVDDEVTAWRERRERRRQAAESAQRAAEPPTRRRGRRGRAGRSR